MKYARRQIFSSLQLRGIVDGVGANLVLVPLEYLAALVGMGPAGPACRYAGLSCSAASPGGGMTALGEPFYQQPATPH